MLVAHARVAELAQGQCAQRVVRPSLVVDADQQVARGVREVSRAGPREQVALGVARVLHDASVFEALGAQHMVGVDLVLDASAVTLAGRQQVALGAPHVRALPQHARRFVRALMPQAPGHEAAAGGVLRELAHAVVVVVQHLSDAVAQQHVHVARGVGHARAAARQCRPRGVERVERDALDQRVGRVVAVNHTTVFGVAVLEASSVDEVLLHHVVAPPLGVVIPARARAAHAALRVVLERVARAVGERATERELVVFAVVPGHRRRRVSRSRPRSSKT